MAVDYEVIDSKGWDALVDQSPYSSPFHQYTWGETVAEHFGATFLPVVAHEQDEQWLLPTYRNLPWLAAGEVQISCIGYGGPLPVSHVSDGKAELIQSHKLLDNYRATLGSKALNATLYPASFWPQELNPKNPYIAYGSTCKVLVGSDTQSVFESTISGSTRTAIRKSLKSGVTVRELRSEDEADVQATFGLLQSTQERVGSTYKTELSLLRAINNLESSSLTGRTFVAEVGGITAAMAVCLYNNRELFHLFHGWDRSFANVRVNQALIWQMLSHAADLKIPTFNMGASHTPAIEQAKLRWGGHLEVVPKVSL